MRQDCPAVRKVQALAIFALLWAALALFTLLWLVPIQRNFDFFPRWYGARMMLRGGDPYDTEAMDTLLQQESPAQVYSPRTRFLYPAWITYVLLPFWLLPFPLAVSLWAGLQLALVIVLPGAFYSALGWRVPPVWLGVVVLVSVVGFFHTVNVYVLGQFPVMILAALLAAWRLVGSDRPWLAALALVYTTIRPEGMILAATFLLDQLLARNVRFVLHFAAIMGALFALSVFHIGFWVFDFVGGVPEYHALGRSTFPAEVLGGGAITGLFMVAVAAWAVWTWWQVRAAPVGQRTLWRVSTAILALLLIFPQSKDYTLVYVLLPMWFGLWLGRGTGWNAILLAAVAFSSWVYAIWGGPHGA